MKKMKALVMIGMISFFLYSCGSNKSEMIVKDWKATEFTLGETKIVADSVVGIYFSFKPDSTFEVTETAEKNKGKWRLNEEGTQIILTYQGDGHSVVQDIKELSSDKLVVEYEDYGMKRSITLVPDKK